jgi:hypothetical protein
MMGLEAIKERKIMDEIIQRIIRQFPDWEILIRQLWDGDEDFRDLCQDYTFCLDTLLHWSAGTIPTARKVEYQSLRQKLEFEIEMKIRSVQPQVTERQKPGE